MKNWWMYVSQCFFAPDGGGPIPGSRQEEGGAPAPKPEAAASARQEVEAKLKQGDSAPPEASAPKPTQATPEDPFVKLKLPGGQEQEVKLSYALQQAAQATDIQEQAAAAMQQLEQLKPLRALQDWVDQDREKRGKQLQDLVMGRLNQPQQNPPSSSGEEDDDALLQRLRQDQSDNPQTDPQLLQRIEQLEAQRQQDLQRQQLNELEGYRTNFFDACKEKMQNFRVFQTEDMRTLGEDRLMAALANDAVLAKVQDPGALVAEIAQTFEKAASTRAQRQARDLRRAKELSGGVAPGPSTAGKGMPKIISDDRRMRDHDVKRQIVERMIGD